MANNSRSNTRSVNRGAAVIQLALFLTAALCVPAFGRAKTDKILMRNGDNLTVEIKELSLGKLKVKTDNMGTIEIEWDKIAAVKSNYHYRVTASGGDVYIGTLDMAADSSRVLRVVMLDMVAGISQESVVSILPIGSSFFDRVDGSLSLGFNFTKASEVSQLSFDWTNIYRGEVNVADLTVNTLITDKHQEEERTNRVDAELGLNRLLGRKKWFGAATAGYQRMHRAEQDRSDHLRR